MNDEDAKVAQIVRHALPDIGRAVEAAANAIRSGGRLIYVGAGTSGRLGMLDAVECVPTFSTPPDLVVGLIAGGTAALTRSVEGAEDNLAAAERDMLALNLKQIDAVVGIAASGKTPYVLHAARLAKDLGATTIGISCNVPAPLLEIVQIPIALPVGPEVITGSTRLKAGTAQKMVLNMLSTATMVMLGKVYGNLMVDVRVSNDKLADRARRIVAQVAQVDDEQAADLLKASNNEVKTAIVVKLRQVTPDEARQMLDAVDGQLHVLIG